MVRAWPMRLRVLLAFQATSYRPDAYVKAAEEAGIDLLLVTDQRTAATHFGLPVQQVAFADATAVTPWCEALAQPLDGVVAVDEASAAWVARVAQRLGLPFHTIAGVDAARDKRLQRERLSEAGVAVPPFWRLPQGGEVGDLPVTFPCVVKPSMLSGSQGVIRADDPAALRSAVRVARGIARHHPSPLRRLPGFEELLVEGYIAGAEVAVEGLMRRGRLQLLAIFDKPDALIGPYFEETLYVSPSRHPEGLQRDLVAVVERACRALGLVHGPIHAELRLSDGGPVIIEVAARSIGGLCAQVLQRRIGSLSRRILCGALGWPAAPLLRRPAAVGVMMVPVPQNGVLRRVDGLVAAAAVPHIDGVNIAILPGDTALMLPYGRRYLGFIFAHAEHPSEVEAALRSAHAALRFEWKRLLPQIC